MKKRYAIADEVPEDCDYLTAGKEYEVVTISDYSVSEKYGRHLEICTDLSGPAECLELSCPHLNGKSWRIVEREE